MKTKLLIWVTVICLLLSCCMTVSAKTVTDYDYILDGGKRVAIPKTHEWVMNIDYIEGYKPAKGNEGVFTDPRDMDIDPQGNIYVVDTGNNAIVKLDKNGNLLFSITSAGDKDIVYPLGIFADQYGDVFFSDNGNQRIVHIDSNGNYIEEFTTPESELLSQNLKVFDPSKIGVIDYTGYLYVLIGKEFMSLDATGSFQGMVGTEPVGFDLMDWIYQRITTEASKRQPVKKEPLPYSNFCITKDNKIYAVSLAETNQIKRINISGDNTFPAGFYGEMSISKDGSSQKPMFSDIAVNSYDLVTVADQNTSLLYQYNAQGDLLAVFGGKGEEKGKFENISAICYDNEDKLYILDSVTGYIQVLETTAFMNMVHKSVQDYLDGNYEKSLEEWSNILRQISNYPVAQSIVADIYYRNGEYDKALDMYKDANMQGEYATVLETIRSDYISQNFFLVISIALVVVSLIIFILIYMYRYSVWIEEDLYDHKISKTRETLGLCQLTIFHPIQAWDLLKWRRINSPVKKERVNIIPIVVLPLLFVLARYFYSYFAAFTVNSMDKQNVSLLFEFLLVVVPYLTLGLSVYKITSVLGGEITLHETFASISYSFIPPIIGLPILASVSHIIAANEISIYNAILAVIYVWMAILIVSAIYRINDLPMITTVGQCVVCLLGVFIVWAMCVLLYIFAAQLIAFADDLFNEILWRMH